jgi:hypothetical protein
MNRQVSRKAGRGYEAGIGASPRRSMDTGTQNGDSDVPARPAQGQGGLGAADGATGTPLAARAPARVGVDGGFATV